jgi:hypothetical protein
VQAECHSFRVGSHGRGLSTGIPTPEPNDDKEQLREPKKKETQGLKHTNLAQSEPTAAGGKDELRAEKHEGAAQEDDPVLSSKLRAVDTPLEGKQSAQENTEENNSLYDASLRYVEAGFECVGCRRTLAYRTQGGCGRGRGAMLAAIWPAPTRCRGPGLPRWKIGFWASTT